MPSPFLQPFQFQGVYFSQGLIMGPNGVPMQIPVAVAPTTPMHTPVNPFDSSASPSRSSSLGTASPFGELEVDHQQWNADMNASLMHFQNSIAQQPAVLPSMTDIPRRSSPISMLPQLITTDLSPHNTNGFCQSPTINISRSPTPDPTAAVSSDASEPPHHARSRSLSASGPSTPTNRERGERGHHHRRLSSGTVSPRYHPFSTVVKSESASSLLQPDSLENEHLSPSAMMNELQLSAPSPASSTTSSQGRSSHRRSRSSETRSRAQRTIAYDENAVFLKNEKHVFVVHTQTRLKAEITEQDVLEIDLDTEDDRNATDSALWQAVHSELLYTNETLMQDCANQSTYHLVSNRAGATTRWEVSFSLDTSSGTPLPSTSIVPTTAILGTPANPTYTFVHFRPGEIVVNPTYPVGSSKWWRVQECNGRHENCPGDGSWTARCVCALVLVCPPLQLADTLTCTHVDGTKREKLEDLVVWYSTTPRALCGAKKAIFSHWANSRARSGPSSLSLVLDASSSSTTPATDKCTYRPSVLVRVCTGRSAPKSRSPARLVRNPLYPTIGSLKSHVN